MGANLLTTNDKNKVIILDTSSNNFFRVFVSSSNVFIARPIATAINTIANTLPLVEKAEIRLLGIMFKIIFNGLEPVEPCWIVTAALPTALKKPKRYTIEAITPAKHNAHTVVIKKVKIVLVEILPNFFVSVIVEIANVIDTNTIGTIISCKELTNN